MSALKVCQHVPITAISQSSGGCLSFFTPVSGEEAVEQDLQFMAQLSNIHSITRTRLHRKKTWTSKMQHICSWDNSKFEEKTRGILAFAPQSLSPYKVGLIKMMSSSNKKAAEWLEAKKNQSWLNLIGVSLRFKIFLSFLMSSLAESSCEFFQSALGENNAHWEENTPSEE